MCRVVWAELYLCLKTPIDNPQIREWWKEVHNSVIFVRSIDFFMLRSKERYCLSSRFVDSAVCLTHSWLETRCLYDYRTEFCPRRFSSTSWCTKKRMKKCINHTMKRKMLQFIRVIYLIWAGYLAQASSSLGNYFIFLFSLIILIVLLTAVIFTL